jgi:hypothetical protein
MIKYLPAILLTFTVLFGATTAVAKKTTDELEARAGEVVIRIAATPCVNKTVLENLKPEYHAQFRKAEIRTAGKPVNGCWTIDDQGVYLMFEDGNQGYVPPQMFKPVETI